MVAEEVRMIVTESLLVRLSLTEAVPDVVSVRDPENEGEAEKE